MSFFSMNVVFCAVNVVFATGQTDTDCPNNGLCCFDGCADTCVDGPAPAPKPAAPKPTPAAPRPTPAAPRPTPKDITNLQLSN